MKHILRKPMLPIILLVIIILGTAFLAYFRADIDAGWRYVDDLYKNTQIEVELVADGGGYLQMWTHKDIIFSGMPEVLETYTMLYCPYVLRDGTPLPPADEFSGRISTTTRRIYGTKNINWFAEYWNMNIQWHSGFSAENFSVTDGIIPCLVQQPFLENNGLEIGHTIFVSPCPTEGIMMANAPEIPAKIVGIYEEPMGRTGSGDLIVPEACFMEAPKLMYGPDVLNQLYYRAYALKIDPAYNREYERIEDELEGFLYDMGGYSFVTNADALEKAARPLIQKLQMQELLVTPLCILFCAAAVVIAVLLGLSMNLEVFLRLMWGEKRAAVFVSLGCVVLVLLVFAVAAAWGADFLTAGRIWAIWGIKYAAATAGLCLAGCAIPLLRACCSNLIKSYQSRESE